jgi:hypothetical protein
MILTTTTAIRVLPNIGQFIASAPANRSITSHASIEKVAGHQKSAEGSRATNQRTNSQPLPGGAAANGQTNTPTRLMSGPTNSSPSSTLIAPSSQSAPLIPSGTNSTWSQSQPVAAGSTLQPAAGQPGDTTQPPADSGASDPLLQISLPLAGASLSLL